MMKLGPVMCDLKGLELLPEEREMLSHPAVGGVILFTRNYTSPEQLSRLTRDIHCLRDPPLLIAVDHEGGTVQRFRTQFSRLPPCQALGQLYDSNPNLALHYSNQIGWLMATELRTVGVDFSFAPVLDLGLGISRVIRDRAFHAQAEVIVKLASAYLTGMREAGMSGVGKHFPGHGSISPDSHYELPLDQRNYKEIHDHDLQAFLPMIKARIPALMPAHIVFQQVDPLPTCFSSRWLKDILRGQFGFQGIIFSDDLSMLGAASIGGFADRAYKALLAGCDMVLVCNNADAAIQVIDALPTEVINATTTGLATMYGQFDLTREALMTDNRWQTANAVTQIIFKTEGIA